MHKKGTSRYQFDTIDSALESQNLMYFHTLKGFLTKEYKVIPEINDKVLYFFTILPLKAKMVHIQVHNTCTPIYVSGTCDSAFESQAMIHSRETIVYTRKCSCV